MTSFSPVHLDYFVYLSSVLGQPELQHLPNGHRSNILLLFQLVGKRGRHDLPLKVRRCIEMQFMILALVRSHKGIKLHFGGCCFNDSHKREGNNKYFWMNRCHWRTMTKVCLYIIWLCTRYSCVLYCIPIIQYQLMLAPASSISNFINWAVWWKIIMHELN